MQAVIIQLSDIHFKTENNPLLLRVEQLSSAIQSVLSHADFCLLAVTGDIAFSGSTEEYSIADNFFDELLLSIMISSPHCIVESIYIPGNHDCDFSQQDQVRKILIGEFIKNSLPPDYKEGDDVFNACLKVQKNFFDFITRRDKELQLNSGKNKLNYIKIYDANQKRIRVQCYNTAWLSQLHEKPGELFLPNFGDEVSDFQDFDLNITLLHHPYNWLEPNNAKLHRKLIEQSSNIVLSGHEHVTEQFTKYTVVGNVSTYIEGAVLQDSYSDISGFNAIKIFLDSREFQFIYFEWENGMYRKKIVGDMCALEQNKSLIANKIENNQDFIDWLYDPGATFTHPVKSNINLNDIFVHPDLIHRANTDNNIRKDSRVHGENLLGLLEDDDRVLILGDEKSGKTALLKRIYSHFISKGFCPVFISGDNLKNLDENVIFKNIYKSFSNQYDNSTLELYEQLDSSKRIILIDNLHKVKLNRKGMNAVFNSVDRFAHKIICFAENMYELQEMLQENNEEVSIFAFQRYEIKEFGHLLRYKLIEKWLLLGQEYHINDVEISHKVSTIDNFVSVIIGKNLLPSYPISILTILQLYEANTNHNTAVGSYGYQYEYLITAALSIAVKGIKKITLDMLYTFLSRVAYDMFSKDIKAIEENELEDIAQEYRKEHKIKFNISDAIVVLENSRMLSVNSEKLYEFRYKYIYYYFTARYITDNLHTMLSQKELRKEIDFMIENIHIEDYANILLFLVYLTKDEQTILKILESAKKLYIDHKPSNMLDDVEFINRFHDKHMPIQLTSGRASEHQELYRKTLDERDEYSVNISNSDNSDMDSEEKNIDDVLKINLAFKSLQIMGQILRNFPGALRGDIKLSIAQESYLLGMRTLSVILSLVEQNLNHLQNMIYDMMKEHLDITDNDELIKRTDEYIYMLLHGAAFSIIKRISQSVGSEHLEETYKEIINSNKTPSFNLIDISIKLDHFYNIPQADIIKLYKELRNNEFVSTILRHMVRDYLYLFPVNYNTRQSICHQLDIKVNDPQMLNPHDKKFSSGTR